MPLLRKVFFLLAVFPLVVPYPEAFGAPSIQRFFPGLKNYRFVLETEVSDLSEQTQIGSFPSGILREAMFRSYSIWSVARSQGTRYRLEVYELPDPSGAFELFSLWPRFSSEKATVLDLPVGNRFNAQGSVFWRGNYFLRVSPKSRKSLSPEEFSEIAKDFFEAFPLENLYPVTVSHLPTDNLVSGSIEFYLGEISLSLNARFPKPLLEEIGFADRIEIAHARYHPDDSALFLIGYPTPRLAEQYLIRLQEGLRGFFSAQGVYMKRAGVIIAVFVGPEVTAQSVLHQVRYAPSIQWLYEKEPETKSGQVLTFLGLLTKTILGTGVFILFILAAGLVVGLLRYEILQRFPGLTRRNEMVRLDLKDK